METLFIVGIIVLIVLMVIGIIRIVLEPADSFSGFLIQLLCIDLAMDVVGGLFDMLGDSIGD